DDLAVLDADAALRLAAHAVDVALPVLGALDAREDDAVDGVAARAALRREPARRGDVVGQRMDAGGERLLGVRPSARAAGEGGGEDREQAGTVVSCHAPPR